MTVFNLKTFTKWTAIGITGAYGFLLSPAGTALVKQYPHMEAAMSGLAMLAALLHVPVKP